MMEFNLTSFIFGEFMCYFIRSRVSGRVNANSVEAPQSQLKIQHSFRLVCLSNNLQCLKFMIEYSRLRDVELSHVVFYSEFSTSFCVFVASMESSLLFRTTFMWVEVVKYRRYEEKSVEDKKKLFGLTDVSTYANTSIEQLSAGRRSNRWRTSYYTDSRDMSLNEFYANVWVWKIKVDKLLSHIYSIHSHRNTCFTPEIMHFIRSEFSWINQFCNSWTFSRYYVFCYFDSRFCEHVVDDVIIAQTVYRFPFESRLSFRDDCMEFCESHTPRRM